ncbi:hypothetical protein DBR42_01665 [Pelomonas sp. HMWF004]|nr:hypothetical protein DBR42_01665 [Pelomonas sp. HMWF004]
MKTIGSSGASLIQQYLGDSALAEVPNYRVRGMKRVRIAPGTFVTIPTGLAERSARVFGTGLTRDQVLAFKASEPRLVGLMAGSPKPLTIAEPWVAVTPQRRGLSFGKPWSDHRLNGVGNHCGDATHEAGATMETALLFVDDFKLDYFGDLIHGAADDGVALKVESRPNSPMAAMEWFVLSGVALYIAKPFVDKFLAKAADDVATAGYPKLKTALKALVKRLYITDRSRFRAFTSAGAKVVDEGAWLFGVYAESVGGQRLKFVFGDGLTEVQYAQAVEELFKLLRAHHLDGVNDEIAKGIGRLLNPALPNVVLLFHAEQGRWHVVDPILEIQSRSRGKP